MDGPKVVSIAVRTDRETARRLQLIADRKYEGVIAMAARIAWQEYIERELADDPAEVEGVAA